jgi:hypothetical protein
MSTYDEAKVWSMCSHDDKECLVAILRVCLLANESSSVPLVNHMVADGRTVQPDLIGSRFVSCICNNLALPINQPLYNVP